MVPSRLTTVVPQTGKQYFHHARYEIVDIRYEILVVKFRFEEKGLLGAEPPVFAGARVAVAYRKSKTQRERERETGAKNVSQGPRLEAGGLQKAPLLPERRPYCNRIGACNWVDTIVRSKR